MLKLTQIGESFFSGLTIPIFVRRIINDGRY